MQHKFLITNFSFVFSETEKVKNQNGFYHVGVGMGDGFFMSHKNWSWGGRENPPLNVIQVPRASFHDERSITIPLLLCANTPPKPQCKPFKCTF